MQLSPRNPPTRCRAELTTALSAGAIATIQLHGDVENVLRRLSGVETWPHGRLRLIEIDGIDTGIAFRLDDGTALLMPHGGVRVVQQIMTALRSIGVGTETKETVDPRVRYPEAADIFEALMLQTMPRLTSPLGLDLLLDQPRRWRMVERLADEDFDRSARLNRLLAAPLVVIAGEANVGKSTLSNRLLGRGMSISADMPGTTRDYTMAQVSLGGLVVHLADTPGLRTSADPIEEEATRLARPLMERADFLIALADHSSGWPEVPRRPDLRVRNKSDLGHDADGDFHISAKTGDGVAGLVRTVRQHLLPQRDLDDPGVWVFYPRLAEQISSLPSRERSAK